MRHFAATALLPLVVLLHEPAAASAEAAGLTLRSFLEAQCGEELAAYEKALPASNSIWQSRVGTKLLDPSNDSVNQVGVWLGSAYPVIDAMVLANARLRPEQRTAVASQLGRALDVTHCLQPDLAQLDAFKADGPGDGTEEIKAVECILQRATILHEAMLSDMADEELRALTLDQTKAAGSACEVVQ